MKPQHTSSLPPNWDGMLTTKNVDQVARLLYNLLADKRYTFVSANEGFRYRPDVRTSNQLEPGYPGRSPINVTRHSDDHVQITVCDTYGVWSLCSTASSSEYDPTFSNPYLSFNHRQVEITHRVPAGHLVYWVVALERET